MPEQYTYQVGKINFIVTPVYKDKRSGETMKDRHHSRIPLRPADPSKCCGKDYGKSPHICRPALRLQAQNVQRTNQ